MAIPRARAGESSASPLISVCIPSYNHGRFVGSCIESVLAQDCRDYEIIAVDNASADDSFGVINGFKDSRLRAYRNPKNLGMVANWNECVKRASGRYIKMLMADDLLMPSSLNTFALLAEMFPEAGLLSCLAQYVDQSGADLHCDQCRYEGQVMVLPSRLMLLGKAAQVAFTRTPTHTMLRRDLLIEAGGYDPQYSVAADTHAHVRLMSRAPVVLIGKSLVRFRRHSGAASDTHFRVFADLYRQIMAELCRLVPPEDSKEANRFANLHADRFALIQAARAIRRMRFSDAVEIIASLTPLRLGRVILDTLFGRRPEELLDVPSVRRLQISALLGT